MTAFGRSVAVRQASQTGRRLRVRMLRVRLGYDSPNPNSSNSS